MNLYQEEILDHYKHPRNKKRLENATYSFESANPLCGDKLGVDIIVKEEIIEDIGFWGEGCAISQAAMSLLSEELINQPVSKLELITKDDILAMLGLESLSGSRQKCAFLSLTLLEKIVNRKL